MRDIIFKFYDRHRQSKNILTDMMDIDDILHGEAYEPEIIFERIAICQWTGVKDRNNKMIFEGDILKEPNGSISTHDFPDDWEWLDMMSDDIEVIGNIYENPELLEGGK